MDCAGLDEMCQDGLSWPMVPVTAHFVILAELLLTMIMSQTLLQNYGASASHQQAKSNAASRLPTRAASQWALPEGHS